MEQVTTTLARHTASTWMIVALMLALALAIALVVYPTSPALAQEEAPQEAVQEAVQDAQEEAQPSPSDQVTFSFELTVKGEVPEVTSLLGFIPAEGGITVPLADPDGDGVYTGSTTLDRFGPGPRPVPPGTEPVSLPVQIVQESGGNIEVIRDFGVVPLNGDRTFSARVNFKRDGRDSEAPEDAAPGTPDGSSEGGGSGASGDAPDLTAPENGVDLNQDGSADEADGQVAAVTSDAAMEAHQASGGNALPATGGAAILQIAGSVGTLLVAVGFLIRRLTR
jgi:hypothetical protein